MKYLSLLLLSTNLFAATMLSTNGAYEINRAGDVWAKYQAGTQLLSATQFGVKAQWSFADQGGAASSDLVLHDLFGQPVKLPAGSIITNCLIDVVTQPVSSTGSGSLALSSKAVADLKAATFPAGWTTTLPLVCIPIGTVGTMIEATSEMTLKIRTGSEALTAGKINVWVQYVISN